MNETFRVQDQNGNELVASRQGILAAQEAHCSAKMIKGLFGALAGLAALGAVTVEPNLFGKIVAPSALGFLAYKLLNGSPHPRVETVEGGEIPVSTAFSKTAVQKHNLAPLMGMALPAALGLDSQPSQVDIASGGMEFSPAVTPRAASVSRALQDNQNIFNML